MHLSLRTQIALLVGALLLSAMGVYVWLATRVVTADKTASVYETDALIAGTVATQIDEALDGFAVKLRYFGHEFESTPGDAERRAKSLFTADEDVLSLEVSKKTGEGFERAYLYVDARRLEAMNISPDDLAEARKRTPVPHQAVARLGFLLQNASLAPDLALLRVSTLTADGNAVISADVRPEWLLRPVATGQLYRVRLVDGQGLTLAHPDAAKVINHQDVSAQEVVKKALHDQVARGAAEFDSPEGPVLGAWARLTKSPGAVVVEVPRDEVFKATRELSVRSILFAAGVVLLALVLGIFVARRVVAPLLALQKTMARVSQGEYGVEAPVDGPSEIRAVGGAFNEMSRELVRRSDELQRTHSQLVQSEKLSAVGELSASVAHEVKNPMVGIVGFAQLGQQSNSIEEMHEFFQLIEEDTLRANKILQNLLEFARPPKVEMDTLELNEVVKATLTLCRHRLQMDGVAVETTLDVAAGRIRGNSSQLRQVLLNLMINAGQAMDGSPKKVVTVTTERLPDGRAVVKVADTGPGMSAEVRQNLFKPFFTTKPGSKGTGLGLSVSKSIIEAHKGTIAVETEEGKGATFVIHLPGLA